MKNGFSKFKTGKITLGVIGLVHRTSATLYSINELGTTTFRAPRLSSYRCRQNKHKCIFNYYKPAVKFHYTHKGNICIRDSLAFKEDE